MKEKTEEKQKAFATMMREGRERIGLSMEAAGRAMDIKASNIGNYENMISFPGPDKIIALAITYNIPLDIFNKTLFEAKEEKKGFIVGHRVRVRRN